MKKKNTVKKNTKKSKKSDFDYFLNAPVLTDEPEIASQYEKAIIEERKSRVANGIRRATDTETMLYLSSMSLKGPLNEEATNVFMYLVTKKMPNVIPKEIRKDNLNESEMHLLHELQSVLFDKVVKLSKQIEQQKEKDDDMGL